MATKRSSKAKKASLSSPKVKTSVAEQAQTIAELRQQLAEFLLREEAKDKKLQERDRQLAEALEQQTSTSEILRVIASSPTDLQPVLDVVAENAARLCEAQDALILRIDGDFFQLAATYGAMPTGTGRRPITFRTPSGRAIRDRQTIHVHNLTAEEISAQFPDSETMREVAGTRTILATPLLREGNSIGAIVIRRQQVQPFTDKQISLLKIFADQAVIAIENVRLFNELKESLEQQTATSEVLRVIAGSPTDIQPVLDAVTESAVKLAGATRGHIRQYDGEFLRLVATYGESPEEVAVFQAPVRPRPESRSGRAFLDRRPIHDVDAQVQRHAMAAQTGARTALAVPLLREETAVGVFTIWRDVVEPFTERQIELVKTFADQAVVAIENVRLFNELKESLEQQTATSEILGVIASSPTDIQPVLDTVAENAARLCDASNSVIHLAEGDVLRRVAVFGGLSRGPVGAEAVIDRGKLSHRAVLDRQVVHVHDLAAEIESEYPGDAEIVQRMGVRTDLAVPLMRESSAIGVIIIQRYEVRPFTDKQINLLKTFAAQSVIAIENVRLFKEIQERNAELREALEHQTATAEVLGIISRSPTERPAGARCDCRKRRPGLRRR